MLNFENAEKDRAKMAESFSLREALANARFEEASYPHKKAVPKLDGVFAPKINPSFFLSTGQTIFTIGSCFARNIENRMGEFALPTLQIETPESEWPKPKVDPGRSIINEYNPATMAQRIKEGLEGYEKHLNIETIAPEAGKYVDLLLHGKAVSFERALERRNLISRMYSCIRSSDVVIITLGLNQAWFDNASGVYLNRLPPLKFAKENSTRYELRVLEVNECVEVLRPAFDLLMGNRANVLLTLSPVPLGRSFSSNGAVVANSVSKGILRSAAQMLCSEFPNVDYFPSYEMVLMSGPQSFQPDNVHVRPEVVDAVVRHMKANYVR